MGEYIFDEKNERYYVIHLINRLMTRVYLFVYLPGKALGTLILYLLFQGEVAYYVVKIKFFFFVALHTTYI